jgi:uncharacterized membrane protein required for colicin V production
MTILDWVLLVLWLGIALSGFWKGAVRIVFGLGGVVAGLWLAIVAGPAAERAMAGVLGEGWIASALPRVLVALACVAVFVVAGWGLQRTLEALHMGWLNRLAGAVLAGAVGALLLAAFVATAVQWSPSFARWSGDSLLIEPLSRIWSTAAGPYEGTAAADVPATAAASDGTESEDDEPSSEASDGSISR